MNAVVDQHQAAIDALCRRYGVERLELFGSAAGGAFDPESSDLDLLVAFRPDSPASPVDRYFGLLNDLQQLLDRKVDLVDIRAARNPYFVAQALKRRELLYAA